MDAATVRSGLVESTHPWSAVIVDADGRTHGEWGDPNRPLYYRSSVKAIQATVSLECGADLGPEQLAVACSSHSGTPAHLALVRSILSGAGVAEAALRCPLDLPLGARSRTAVVRDGHRPKRIFHNCSGKHAGFLAACRAQGWPLDTYTEPDHPLQRRVAEVMNELTGIEAATPGIDGCGVPTLPGTIRGLARAFAILSVADRFARARTAIMRYPALTSGNDRPDGRLAMWWSGPAKGGAEGVLVAARHGMAIATKSHGGSIRVATQGLIEIAARTGMLPTVALVALAADHQPPVLGGGRPVGSVLATTPGDDA